MSGWQLAQVNIGRLQEPLDHPQLAAFVEALDPVNAAAERAPGFVWRLQTEDGNATSVEAFTWDAGESAGMIINMSVWTDVEHLTAFVLGDLHRAILRRRREFFQKMAEAYLACWWVPEGHRPSTDGGGRAGPLLACPRSDAVRLHPSSSFPASRCRGARGAATQ